jgi:hypothetical protein
MLKNDNTLHFILFILCAWALSACSGGDAPSSPTATAQAERAIRMATQIAREMNSIFETIAKWPVAISEPFEENILGWADGEDTSPELASIKWELEGGKYRWEAQAVDSFVWWAVPDMDDLTDFHLQVAARQMNNPDLGEYGLIFRLMEDGSYYLFEINEQGQTAVFIHLPDGWETLRDWNLSQAVQPGQTNVLGVAAKSDEFYFFVNQQLVGRFKDDRLPEGKAGLLIGLSNPGDTSAWLFDDFVLRVPEQSATPTP